MRKNISYGDSGFIQPLDNNREDKHFGGKRFPFHTLAVFVTTNPINKNQRNILQLKPKDSFEP